MSINEWFEEFELSRNKNVCICCKQPFDIKVNKIDPLRISDDLWKPGLIYSKAGLKEKDLSGMCEFCFDNLFPG